MSWGGIKHRKLYTDTFRSWSTGKPMDALRKELYREPRPWWVGWSLHHTQHRLDPRGVSQLLRWCATTVKLHNTMTKRLEAYKLSQELMNLVDHAHDADKNVLNAYLALCETVGDLTSAYKWVKYYVEKHRTHEPAHYVWLLRVAARCPVDVDVEDTVAAVQELYDATLQQQLQPQFPTDYDEALHKELFRCMLQLQPRLDDEALHRWIEERSTAVLSPSSNSPGPLTFDEQPDATATLCKALGLVSGTSVHAGGAGLFPQLEQLVPRRAQHLSYSTAGGAWGFVVDKPSIVKPFLVDSLHSDEFVNLLETAAFEFDTKKVTLLISAMIKDTTAQREAQQHNRYYPPPTPNHPLNSQEGGATQQTELERYGPMFENLPIWKDYHTATASHFRQQILNAQDGVTSELFHYLIVSLSRTAPRLALSTRTKMKAQGMRLLDLTRAVLVVAAHGSRTEQIEILREQMDDVSQRQKVDEDNDVCKAVEAYWKYDYALLVHYRNALTMADFYELLMPQLGVTEVQRLLLESEHHGVNTLEEDLCVVNEALRAALVSYFRKTAVGPRAVSSTMDLITQHCPVLDIAVMSEIPYFSEYCLPPTMDICTSNDELVAKYASFDSLYICDSSFIEASENFMQVSMLEQGSTSRRTGLLIPYTSLKHLADTAEEHVVPCFDEAVAKMRSDERRIGTQRLQSIHTLIASTIRSLAQQEQQQQRQQEEESSAPPSLSTFVLHFTEMLLAQVVSSAAVPDLGTSLRPELDDDDLLISISVLLSSLLAARGHSTKVFLCTEDRTLLRRLKNDPVLAALIREAQLSVISSTEPEASIDSAQNPTAAAVGPTSSAPSFGSFDVTEFVPKLEQCNTNARRQLDGVSLGIAADSDTSAERSSSATAMVSRQQQPEQPSVSVPKEEFTTSSWLDMLEEDTNDLTSSSDESVTLSSVSQSRDGSVSGMHGMPSGIGTHEETPPLAALSSNHEPVYPSPYALDSADMVVEQAQRAAAGSTMFSEFGVRHPDSDSDVANGRQGHSKQEQENHNQYQWIPKSKLAKEASANRGYSVKQRGRMARRMSNYAGSRVPFHFKFDVYEANVNDPRNADLLNSFHKGVSKKREIGRKRHEQQRDD